MIKGKQVEVREGIEKPSFNYRKLDALNQSMIKLFDENPVQFFNEFKMGKKRKSKSNNSLIIGDIVDFYILECKGDEQEFENRFDEKFALFQGTKGTGQVFILADYLFEETENCTNEKGEITCSFMERFRSAYNRVIADEKYKDSKSKTGYKDMEKVLEDFEKNGKDYFQMKMDNVGKTVVDISIVDKAKTVANNILNDEFTKYAFGKDLVMEYLTHFPIEWKYDLGGGKYVTCKSEIDMMYIDHTDKVIYPMDLKTTYDNESFDYMYIKNGYYLQNAFYHKAITVWAAENDMGDYTVMPLDFVVGDTSSNNRRPLVYKTDMEDIERGMNGFFLKGTKYRGIAELIVDIAWAEESDEWRCSKEAYERNGRMELNVKYD